MAAVPSERIVMSRVQRGADSFGPKRRDVRNGATASRTSLWGGAYETRAPLRKVYVKARLIRTWSPGAAPVRAEASPPLIAIDQAP